MFRKLCFKSTYYEDLGQLGQDKPELHCSIGLVRSLPPPTKGGLFADGPSWPGWPESSYIQTTDTLTALLVQAPCQVSQTASTGGSDFGLQYQQNTCTPYPENSRGNRSRAWSSEGVSPERHTP